MTVVPGTKLYTGIYYTLSMRAFPQGWVTWLNDGDVYNVEVDLDPASLPKYAVGKPFEHYNEWTIGSSDKTGKFTLKNRRAPLGLLCYSNTKPKGADGFHASIFDSSEDRKKMAPGGTWHEDALWKLQSVDKAGKYYKVENVGKAGNKLTWSYTRPSSNRNNYYVQLVNYDVGEDGQFLFTPTAIKLSARIYDFKFEDEPEDIFNNKDGQKRTLISKYRYPNDSPATITTTLEETVESKTSATFTFTESFSMMIQTSLEVNFAIFKGGISTQYQGGFTATQGKTVETTKKTSLKTEIKVPPYSDVEASIYNVWAEDVVLPFKSKMLVTGVTQRIVADQPDKTQDGDVPGDVIEAYIKAKGGPNMKILKRTDDSILVELTGKVKGNIALESTVSTREVRKIKPRTINGGAS